MDTNTLKSLLAEAYAIDMAKPNQLLVLRVSQDTTPSEMAELQEMMAALCKMTGLQGAITTHNAQLTT